MIGVFVTFTYETPLDEPKLRRIAQNAQSKFEGMPGLRSKVYTLRPERRQATNVYVWDSEEVACAFFTPKMLEHIASLYGVEPSIEFVAIAGLVANGPR